MTDKRQLTVAIAAGGTAGHVNPALALADELRDRGHMTDKRQLTVAIAAGGTAGHVNPALALADELRDRGHEVHFFGESRRLEGTLVPKEGFPFHPVHVTGFDRRRPWTLVTALVPSRTPHRFRSPPPLDARDRARAFVT